jgi:hypothetical protein
MKAKRSVPLMLGGSSLLMTTYWAWALVPGLALWRVLVGIFLTSIIYFALWGAIRGAAAQDRAWFTRDIVVGLRVVAVAAAIVALSALCFERVPSRRGDSTITDRRYSIVAAAVAGCFLVGSFAATSNAKKA